MSSSPLRPRAALIGVSGYGVIYYDLLLAAVAQGEIELSAAVIINPDEEAAKETELRSLGTRIYRDYEEMLRAEAGRIDVCLIPTGIPWHARMTIAALRAGANVVVEKPLAGSNAEVTAIRAAEAATGKFVAVGFQDIYCPINRWLKEQICSGAIGKLHTVRFIGLWPRPAAYFTRNPWAGRLHADGTQVLDSPLNNAFAHFVNLSLYFAGDTIEASADVRVDSTELLRAHAIESFDTAVVLAHSTTGVKFWFGVTHTCHHVREPEIYLEGSDGRVEWKHERSCVIIRKDGVREERRLTDISLNRKALLDTAYAKLQQPDTAICTTALAARHTSFVEAVHAAGTVQTVPSSLVVWKSPTPSAAPVPGVTGLEDALCRAFESKTLLRDAGFTLDVAHA